MISKKLDKFVLIALLATWTASCSTNSTDEITFNKDSKDTDVITDHSYGVRQDNSMSQAIVDDDHIKDKKSKNTDPLNSIPATLYFDVDESTIHSDDLESLTKYAHYLIAHSESHIVLEGYTDERGTREYNMALGERRAQAVARFLVTQGVSESQIKTVSFGEELCVACKHTEASWKLNRRVEVRY